MKKVIGIIIFLIFCLVGYVFLVPVRIPVLTYHDFVEGDTTNDMQITQSEFEREIKFLRKHHYHSISLKELECFLEKKCKLPRKSVLITMDDGWIGEYKIALPILKKYNMKAVIFYIGEHYDSENPNFIHRDEINKIKEDYPNIEIASHSYALHFEDAYQLSKEEIIEDIKLMKEENDSKYYAYPYGRHSTNYEEALKEEGYSLAFTFGPDKEHRKVSLKDSKYAIPRLNMSHGMPFLKFVLRLNWVK